MTLRRARALTDPERIVIVTSEEHRTATTSAAAEIGISTIITEPSQRDTTAAALLGVREIERLWGPSRVVSLPADHEIGDEEAWLRAMLIAVEAPPDRIATVGIHPTSPSVDYGYIETPPGDDARLSVVRFHEKPSANLARRYLVEGRFLWNTAMMSFTTDGFLAALTIAGQDVIDAVDAAGAPSKLDPERWAAVRAVALEHSLMEPAADAGLVDVVPATFPWRDLGSWTVLAPLLSSSGEVLSTEPDTHVVVPPGVTARRYVNVGVPGLIVIDTGDVVLITTAAESSRVKGAVRLAEDAGWEDVL
jgi:mannose-1-phosphate guanylyltransferase